MTVFLNRLFRSVTKEEKEKENTRKVMPIANAMPPAGRPSSVQARPIYGLLQDDKTVRGRSVGYVSLLYTILSILSILHNLRTRYFIELLSNFYRALSRSSRLKEEDVASFRYLDESITFASIPYLYTRGYVSSMPALKSPVRIIREINRQSWLLLN